jgi:hypothetical protein
VSTRRRLAIWWRLLIATSVVAAPLALSGVGPAAGTWRGHAAPLQVHVQLTRAAVVTADKLSTVAHHAVHRPPGHLAADAVAGLGPLVWLVVATSSGRSRGIRRGRVGNRQTRAPPQRTASVVPFGLVPGNAGRFARSHRAHIHNITDGVVC